MFITKRKHDAIVAHMHKCARELTAERDAETKRANELAAELAHWKANAQMRDPKTGRLIPKEAAAAKRKVKGEGV